jgi:hypothetical protein
MYRRSIQPAGEQIALEKLIGADVITATELSRTELTTLEIEDGETRL